MGKKFKSMTPYETLKSEIQKAVPSIMELKFGCEVEDKSGVMMVVSKAIIREENHSAYYRGRRTFEGVLTKQGRKIQLRYILKILGRKIRLSDVFVALGKIGSLTESSKWLINLVEDSTGFKDVRWNLLDDDLDHQSDECKQFLISLLVKPL